MRKVTPFTFLMASLIAVSFPASAQDMAAIQQKLVSDYPLTTPTAAFDDIVTAGAVLVLQKGPLTMVTTSTSINPYPSTYKDGQIRSPAAKGKHIWDTVRSVPGMSAIPGGTGPGTRTFVTGEKMWVTKIDVRNTGVILDLFTDSYKDASGNDVRYKTSLTFPFPKGWAPTPDQVEKVVGEVFKVQPGDDAKTDDKQQAPASGQKAVPSSGQPAQPAAPQQAAEAPPPPIAPPPPPPADPKRIALKQTIDEVVANFGQPKNIIDLGSKKIYVYPDMKVTFVGGKVTDVQ